jgi:hypothetical protein
LPWIPALLALGFVTAAGGPARAIESVYTFTTEADFAKGSSNSALVLPGQNAVTLTGTSILEPYLYVANYNYATVSRVDTRDGREVARYPACLNNVGNTGLCPAVPTADLYPHRRCNWSSQGHCPSRTAVDLDGDVWVANRAFGRQPSVTQIAGSLSRCKDRNGNGIIESSRDLNANGRIDLSEGDSMPLSGTPGVNEWLGQADECVLFTVPVGASGHNARGLAVGPDNRVWVGTHDGKQVHVLDNDTGAVLVSHTPNEAIYGLASDALGYLYMGEISGGTLTQMVMGTGAVSRKIQFGGEAYGIAAEATSQVVWFGDWSTQGAVIRANFAQESWKRFPNLAWLPQSAGGTSSASSGARTRGVTFDKTGRVWVANSSHRQVGVFDPQLEAWVANYPHDQAPIGVGMDNEGFVWAVGSGNPGRATRYDPLTGATLTSQPLGDSPYSYSDMTGSILTQFITKVGTWTVVVDGTLPGRKWEEVSWNQDPETCPPQACEPPGTDIRVQVRASDDPALPASFTTIESGQPIDGVVGRYVEVEVSLRAPTGTEPPSLHDLVVEADKPPVVTAVLPPTVPRGFQNTVLIEGHFFEPGMQVDFGPDITVGPVVVHDDSQATVTIVVSPNHPLGPRPVTVTTDDSARTSPGLTITAPPPTLTGALPAVVSPGSTTTVTLVGSGLPKDAAVVPDEGSCSPPSTGNGASVVVEYTAPSAPTLVSWTCTTPGGSAQLPGGITVYGPTHSSGAPGEAGGVAVVKVVGVGLGPQDTIEVQPPFEIEDAKFENGAWHVVVALPDAPSSVGSHPIEFSRPDLGVAHPLPNAFTVVGRPPELDVVVPDVAVAGSNTLVTVVGDNLLSGSTYTFGPGVSTSVAEWHSEQEVVLALFTSSDAAPGPRSLTVVTPYGVAVLPDAILVRELAVTGALPPVLSPGTSQEVTLIGGGFLPGLVVGIEGGPLVVDVEVVGVNEAVVGVETGWDCQPGPRDVTVKLGPVESTAQNVLTVVWPAPDIQAVTPDLVSPGVATVVQVSGEGLTPVDTFEPGYGAAVLPGEYVEGKWELTLIASPQPGPRALSVTHPGGTDLQDPAYTVFGPISVQPQVLEQGDTAEVKVTGHGFGPDIALSFGPGVAVSNTIVESPQLLRCTVTVAPDSPVGPHTLVATRQEPAVLAKLPDALQVNLNPPPPTLESCDPGEVEAGSSTTLVLRGSHFTPNTLVDLGPGVVAADVQVLTDSRIEVIAAVDGFAEPGSRPVSVKTPYGSATLDPAYTVVLAPLTIVSISPEPVGLPGTPLTFTVVGTGFVPTLQLEVETPATVVETHIHSHTQLTATVVLPSAPGRTDLALKRGEETATAPDALLAFGPTGIVPPSAKQGEALAATVHGAFAPGTQVISVGEGIGLGAQVQGPTTIALPLVVGEDAALGPRDVAVVWGDIGASLDEAFTVLPGPPKVSGVSPDAVETNQSREIRVDGKNLIGCTVSATGPATVVSSAEAGGLTLQVSVLTGAQPGVVSLSIVCTSGEVEVPDAFEVLDGPEPPVPQASAATVEFSKPKMYDQFPSSGGPVPVSTTIALSGFVPGVDGVVRYSLNSAQVGESSAGLDFVFPAVPPGRQHLTASLIGSDGSPLVGPNTRHTVWINVRTPCNEHADCADTNPCSVEKCVSGSCSFGPLPSKAQICCMSSFDCPFNWACHEGFCRQCDRDSACFDGVGCTVDTCGPLGLCSTAYQGNCCETDAHCNDGLDCTIDTCTDSGCKHAQIADCCDSAEECDDGDPCTKNFCTNNQCQFAYEGGDCCSKDSDCNDGKACTVDTCNTAKSTCKYSKLPSWECCEVGDPACCNADNECNDRNHCTIDICNIGDHTCTHVRVPMEVDSTCCVSDVDCADGVPCNVDRCVRGDCRHGPDPKYGTPWIPYYNTCCVADPASIPHYTPYLGCDDFDACTIDWCDGPTFTCQHQDVGDPNCCTDALDCEDGDAATLDACIGNQCTFIPDPSYCATDADCEDGDACTADHCAANGCTYTVVPGCCRKDKQCQDGDPCTKDLCDSVSNTCTHQESGACCAADADCDDGKFCTADFCGNGRCRHFPKANCCTSDAQCKGGGPCAVSACVEGSCALAKSNGPDCCTKATDCNDTNPCTQDSCLPGVGCIHAPIQGCCARNSECNDGDVCTADTCEQASCTYTPLTECCRTDAECEDGDPCTTDTCADKQCQQTPADPCAAELPVTWSFVHDSQVEAEQAGWRVESFGDTGAEAVLSNGKLRATSPVAQGEVWVYSPLFAGNSGQNLSVQVEVANWKQLSSAAMELYVSADNTNWTKASWLDAAGPQGPLWTWAIDELSGVPLARVALRIRPPVGGSVALDRFTVSPGRPPEWLVPTGSTVSLNYLGNGLPVVSPIEALDPDGLAVGFVLVGAPSWVRIEQFSLTTLGFGAKVVLTQPPEGAVAPEVWLFALDSQLASVRRVIIKL